jgi:type II secretory pathway pseudopilin PulG
MNNLIKSKSGFVLPIVLVVMALLAGSAGIVLAEVQKEIQTDVKYRDYQISILTAKNALARMQSELYTDSDFTGCETTTDPNGGTYIITVNKVSETLRFFEIDAYCSDYSKKMTGTLKIIEPLEGDPNSKKEIEILEWKMVTLL